MNSHTSLAAGGAPEKKKKYKPGQGPNNKSKSQAEIMAEKALVKKQKEEDEMNARIAKEEADLKHSVELEKLRRAKARFDAIPKPTKEEIDNYNESLRLAFHARKNHSIQKDKFHESISMERSDC